MQRFGEGRVGAEASSGTGHCQDPRYLRKFVGNLLVTRDNARLSPNQFHHVFLYVVCQLMEILFESAVFCGNPILLLKERFPSAKNKLFDTREIFKYACEVPHPLNIFKIAGISVES